MRGSKILFDSSRDHNLALAHLPKAVRQAVEIKLTHYRKKKWLRHGLLIVVKSLRNGNVSRQDCDAPPFSTE
jgi:hypothetical protein